MALTKTVNIDGKDVTFRASAAIPRIYRNKFHRDIYKDLHDLQKSIDENDPENSALDSFSLELFEDISYIMAKHADPQFAVKIPVGCPVPVPTQKASSSAIPNALANSPAM